MPHVDTPRALMVMAMQDLHDGERALAERLEKVHDCLAEAALRELVAQDRSRSIARCTALAQIARELDAAPDEADNVWLAAILDDAENDCASIVRGPLRDIALAGALRKGKLSQRVSYETAIALARALDMGEAAGTLSRMAAAAEAADTALARVLVRLCGGLQDGAVIGIPPSQRLE